MMSPVLRGPDQGMGSEQLDRGRQRDGEYNKKSRAVATGGGIKRGDEGVKALGNHGAGSAGPFL